jgi:hypothetical protein
MAPPQVNWLTKCYGLGMPGEDEKKAEWKAEIKPELLKVPDLSGYTLRGGLELIVEYRAWYAADPSDYNREAIRVALKVFSQALAEQEADIPGDILEALGPEDRRAALLAFCNLVAIGTFGQPRQKPKPPPPLIIIPGRKL